jgi:uncharacterized membrane protein
MKRNIKELKRIARGNLEGNYIGLIQAFMICNLIVSLIETPFSIMTNDDGFSMQNIIYIIAITIITIASVVFTVGQYCLHLRIARKEKVYFKELFYPLKHDANRLILTETIVFVIELIGMSPVIGAIAIVYFYDSLGMYVLALILSIIGCILTLWVSVTFGLVYFVLIDGEELSVKEAVKTTLAFIKGHKKRFLYLQFSFIGMYLLSLISFGIGILWVQPYVMQTTTLFYLDIKGELDGVLEVSI